MKSVLITSSILILLIAALRPLLRGRIDPRIQYALWLAVSLRLLLPVNLFTSAYSALALLERTDRGAEIVETIGQTSIPAQSYDSARAQVVEEYRRQGVPEAQLTPGDLMSIDTQARELMRGPTLAELAAQYARPVWLGGAAAMALWFTLINLRLRRRLRDARRIEADCPLPVYVTGALPSPCLCGVLRPRLYVTPAALESPDRLRHVLAHELTHYRHRDHWWALVRCACLCLYWFDPLAWWAAALSRQDCELACDEGAIRALGEEERIPYGRTLVGMIAAGRTPLLQTATTMTGGKRRVRERVKLIARRPKTVIALALAAALLVGCAVGCTFSGAPEGGKPMSATVDSLQARLQNIPEELQADVVALPGSQPTATLNNDFTALAQYWMNRPWADYDEIGMGWLLTVYQWDQEQFERYYPELEVTGGVNCFAKDDKFYYVTFKATDARAPLSETGYADAFEAIRAYAMETVLETEGVELYAPGQPVDTLPARLLDIPEELRADVTAVAPDSGDVFDDVETLATYVFNCPGEDLDMSRYLLIVSRISRERGDRMYGGGSSGLGGRLAARGADCYYLFQWNTSIEYDYEKDAERFGSAQRAVNEFAEQEILSTDGVEPLAPQADTLPARLRNLPAELQADVVLRDVEIPEDGSTRFAVSYWMKLSEEEWAVGAGHLANVYLWSEWMFRSAFYGVDHSGMTCFARTDDNYYFVIAQPTSAAYPRDTGPERYQELFDAVPEFIRETVLSTQGVEPFDPDALTPAQADIKSVTDAISNAPSIHMALSVKQADGSSAGYIQRDVTDYSSYWARRLNTLATDFEWEAFPNNIPDELLHSMQRGGGLTISAPDGPALILHQTDNVIWVSHGDGEGTTLYRAVSSYGVPLDQDSSTLNPGPYHQLRGWFDEVELKQLRVASVPDRGQSRQDVVKEWLEGFEGAYLKCAPGSQFACTYVEGRDVEADQPDWMDDEQLAEFARSYGLEAAEFKRSWFGFRYSLLFVPADEHVRDHMMAGNTHEYDGAGRDAPEGAMVYTRQAIMQLIDGRWICEQTGTGW